MDDRIRKWLFDVKQAIDEIESYFKDNPVSFFEYRSNTLLKRAVERDLEIIGEAINRILKVDPQFPIEHAKKIIGLRNQIIHSYDSISDENIWGILKRHIPILKTEIENLTN